MQWLPSYCNQKGTNCCYPPTGKPATNFSIYGLWPYQDDGSCLQNCPGSTFDVSLVCALIFFRLNLITIYSILHPDANLHPRTLYFQCRMIERMNSIIVELLWRIIMSSINYFRKIISMVLIITIVLSQNDLHRR